MLVTRRVLLPSINVQMLFKWPNRYVEVGKQHPFYIHVNWLSLTYSETIYIRGLCLMDVQNTDTAHDCRGL
jgi:hypothetical protein